MPKYGEFTATVQSVQHQLPCPAHLYSPHSCFIAQSSLFPPRPKTWIHSFHETILFFNVVSSPQLVMCPWSGVWLMRGCDSVVIARISSASSKKWTSHNGGGKYSDKTWAFYTNPPTTTLSYSLIPVWYFHWPKYQLDHDLSSGPQPPFICARSRWRWIHERNWWLELVKQ